MKRPLYRVLSAALQARWNCVESGNAEWQARYEERIAKLAAEHLPSGAGIDCGTKVPFASDPQAIRLTLSFHHMDENGSYDGWTDHIITVRPHLEDGFRLSISGENRNDIKDYLHEVYDWALRAEVEEFPDHE